MATSESVPNSRGSNMLPAIGSAVMIDGKLVAWFMDPELAEQWASENYFGQWLIWKATSPEIVPLSNDEVIAISEQAVELSAKFAKETRLAD